MKEFEKEKAVALRRRGFTYLDILAKVPVAKSTLSLWLREVRLAKRQEQKLTERRRAAQLKGAAVRRQQRIERTTILVERARAEIGRLSKRELRFIGLALYWAEGSKEKTYAGAGGVDFSNTDWRMIRLFINWLKVSCEIPSDRIYAHIYIHEYQRGKTNEAKSYWARMSGLHSSQITGIYFKKHNPKSRRHSFHPEYYGTLRVRVRKSSNLVRSIQGWVEGLCEHDWGVV